MWEVDPLPRDRLTRLFHSTALCRHSYCGLVCQEVSGTAEVGVWSGRVPEASRHVPCPVSRQRPPRPSPSARGFLKMDVFPKMRGAHGPCSSPS